MQNKKPIEIILHIRRVTNLQSWVTNKSSHGQTLINDCFISDYPSNFEGKSNINKIALFNSLENPKGRTVYHFFHASHICHNFPYKLISLLMS